jgi:hypothetical protein
MFLEWRVCGWRWFVPAARSRRRLAVRGWAPRLEQLEERLAPAAVSTNPNAGHEKPSHSAVRPSGSDETVVGAGRSPGATRAPGDAAHAVDLVMIAGLTPDLAFPGRRTPAAGTQLPTAGAGKGLPARANEAEWAAALRMLSVKDEALRQAALSRPAGRGGSLPEGRPTGSSHGGGSEHGQNARAGMKTMSGGGGFEPPPKAEGNGPGDSSQRGAAPGPASAVPFSGNQHGTAAAAGRGGTSPGAGDRLLAVHSALFESLACSPLPAGAEHAADMAAHDEGAVWLTGWALALGALLPGSGMESPDEPGRQPRATRRPGG